MGIKFYWPVVFVCVILMACILVFPSDLRLADLLNRSGKLEEAVAAYRRAIEVHPHRSDLRIELGKLYLKIDRPEQAVAEFEAAAGAHPHDLELLERLADLYGTAGMKKKSVAAWEKLVAAAPENRRFRETLAEAYEWNDQTEQAISAYESLLGEDPTRSEYLQKLIYLSLNVKHYEDAIRYQQRLLRQQPNDWRGRILLGDLYRETGRKPEAAREFERVLSQRPDDDSLRVKLAELYLWMGDQESGIAHYDRLVRQQVLNDDYFERGVELTRDFAPEKAIDYHRLRLKCLPNDAALRARLVDLYLHYGDTEQARTQLLLLAENHPEEPTYLRKLAVLYEDLREPQLAAEMYERLRHMGQTDRETYQRLLQFYVWEKDYDRLLPLYAEIIELPWADGEIRRDYARALVAVGQYDAARQQYEKLIALEPENPGYRVWASRLCFATERPQRGLEIAEEGLSRYITDESFLVYAAELFEESGRAEESLLCYQRLAALDSMNLSYSQSLARLYAATGRLDDALQTYAGILRDGSNGAMLHLELADLYWQVGNETGMRETIERLARQSPDAPFLHRDVGGFFFERMLFDDAIENLQMQLQRSPTDSLTLRMLGLSYAWSGQSERARKSLNAYHELYPRDYYTRYQLGELYFRQQETQAAELEFEAAMELLSLQSPTKETRIVMGKLYVRLGQELAARQAFESLLAEHPEDVGMQIEYAESLLDLRDYEGASYRIDETLALEPENYSALRLKSRWLLERGKPAQAAEILASLQQRYWGQLELKIARADAELAAGDWYESTEALQAALRQAPRHAPARQRLNLLRREIGESAASEFSWQQQSGNFIRRAYRFVASKAKSSLLHLKAFLGWQEFATKDASLPDADYESAGLEVASWYDESFRSSIAGSVNRSDDETYISGRALLRWQLDTFSAVTLSGEANELWRDPLTAAFRNGRRWDLHLESNLAFWRRLVLWGRIGYEGHGLGGRVFGQAYRANVELGYRLRARPYIVPYYQLYYLRYNYETTADRSLVVIPEREVVHHLGALVNQQASPNFFYEVSGSIGYNPITNAMLYFGALNLEYVAFDRLRLRSQLTYGSQSQFIGQDDSKSLVLDLYYFY